MCISGCVKSDCPHKIRHRISNLCDTVTGVNSPLPVPQIITSSASGELVPLNCKPPTGALQLPLNQTGGLQSLSSPTCIQWQ